MPGTARTRTVALMNQKGGVGKTTTAVNLAAALAEAERRVCLVDLDPQAHVAFHLGLEAGDTPTVYDLLTDPARPVEDCVINARPHLDAVLAEVDLAAAESELADRPDRRRILGDRLAPLAGRYDYVLLDCPPSLGLLTVAALTFAGEVLVPMQAHFLALQGVGKLLETVGLVSRAANPRLRVAGIILCMYESQTTLAREVVVDLDEFFESSRGQDLPWDGCRVLRPPIRRNIKLAEAPSFGQTIFDYAPWCAGANDYRRLAERLLAEWERPAHLEPKLDGEARPASAPEIATWPGAAARSSADRDG